MIDIKEKHFNDLINYFDENKYILKEDSKLKQNENILEYIIYTVCIYCSINYCGEKMIKLIYSFGENNGL